MSNPNPETLSAPEPAPRWLRILLLVALFGALAGVVRYSTAIAAGSDASGYLNFARLMAEGRITETLRVPVGLQPGYNPVHFVPLGFYPIPNSDQVAPTYPPGVPIHQALASKVLGWDAGPIAVLLFAAAGTLVAFYLAARELRINPLTAGAGAAVLGLSPIFVFSSLQPLSDGLATTWVLISFWATLRSRRGTWLWALLAGFALSTATLVRPTNALAFPLLLLGLDWRRWPAAFAGGLPGAVFFLYLNNTLFGSPFRTGYGPIEGIIGWEWLQPTLKFYAEWIPKMVPVFVALLPFVIFASWRRNARVLATLLLWWLAIAGFYALYAVTHEVWWCLRFILPAFPALGLLGLLGLDQLLQRPTFPRWSGAAAAVVLVIAGWFALDYWRVRFDLLHLGRYELAYRDVARWTVANLPKNAVVATLPASGSVYFYTPFSLLRWDTMSPQEYRRYADQIAAAGTPTYALLFPGEDERALREIMPGEWKKLQDVSGIAVWQLSLEPKR